MHLPIAQSMRDVAAIRSIKSLAITLVNTITISTSDSKAERPMD